MLKKPRKHLHLQDVEWTPTQSAELERHLTLQAASCALRRAAKRIRPTRIRLLYGKMITYGYKKINPTRTRNRKWSDNFKTLHRNSAVAWFMSLAKPRYRYHRWRWKTQGVELFTHIDLKWTIWLDQAIYWSRTMLIYCCTGEDIVE